MARVLIVGGGIVGSVCAKLARVRGHTVKVWDDARPCNGSTASAGVMHPGWSPVSPLDRNRALDILGRLYEDKLQDVQFYDPAKGKRITCPMLSPEGILERDRPETSRDKVVTIGNGWLQDERVGTDGGYVYVATGSWAGELWHKLRGIKATVGTAFIWNNYNLIHNYLTEWAPYKQLMVFNQGSRVWGGDGTAIIPKNYTDDRERQTLNRIHGLAPLHMADVGVRGRRPVITGEKAGFCGQVMPKCWVATGGSKSSTLLAPLWAEQFLDSIGR